MRISDWSSDVCSSDLLDLARFRGAAEIRRQTKLLEADEDAGRARHDAGANQHVRCDASRCWGKTQVLDPTAQKLAHQGHGRSEERRVGKECVRTRRSRWSPKH